MINEEKELAAAIWLFRLGETTFLSGKTINGVIKKSGGIANVLDQDESFIIKHIEGPPEKIIRAKKYINDISNIKDANEISRNKYKIGIKAMDMGNKLYPKKLKNIQCPPTILFYTGKNSSDIFAENYYVSVVGTRNPSPYGKAVSRKFVSELVEAGAVIVSGMARGIDSIAHQITLDNKGKTIAVLGCGVDVLYPSENRRLMHDIIANGVLISEYPPGTKPLRSYFPARNRIISGICDSLVITEAAKKSGTMITAGFAGDQGRDIFAVPGSIFSPESQGTNQLIQDGACVLTDISDMFWRSSENYLI